MRSSLIAGLAFATRSFCRTRLRATAGGACRRTALLRHRRAMARRSSLEDAKKVAAGAEAEMKKNNWNLVIAIVGPSGDLVYLQKADLAAVASVTVAQEKAQDVRDVSLRRPRPSWTSRQRRNLFASPARRIRRSPAVIPIVMGGKVVGAIGISGASALQDHQTAQAGIDALK